MAFCCTISTFAADDTSTQQAPYIEARFTDFSNVNIFLTQDDYGFLHVEGSAGTSSSAASSGDLLGSGSVSSRMDELMKLLEEEKKKLSGN